MHREAAAKPPRVVLEKAVRHEARPEHLQTAARTVRAGRGQHSLPEGRPPDGAPAYGGVAAVSGEPLRDDAVRDKPARHRQRPSQIDPGRLQPAVGDRQTLQNRLRVKQPAGHDLAVRVENGLARFGPDEVDAAVDRDPGGLLLRDVKPRIGEGVGRDMDRSARLVIAENGRDRVLRTLRRPFGGVIREDVAAVWRAVGRGRQRVKRELRRPAAGDERDFIATGRVEQEGRFGLGRRGVLGVPEVPRAGRAVRATRLERDRERR